MVVTDTNWLQLLCDAVSTLRYTRQASRLDLQCVCNAKQVHVHVHTNESHAVAPTVPLYYIPRLAPCQCTAIAMYLGQCSLSMDIPTEIYLETTTRWWANRAFIVNSYNRFPRSVCTALSVLGYRVPLCTQCSYAFRIGTLVHRGSCAMYLMLR